MANDAIQKRFVLIIFALIFLLISFSGCLGIHKECPSCDGRGFNIRTSGYWDEPPLSECSKCDGDGEVGYLVDNELIEDILSFTILIIIIFSIAITIYFQRRVRYGTSYSYNPYHQPQYPPQQYQQSDYTVQQYQNPRQLHYPQQPLQQSQFVYCSHCGKQISFESKFCDYCGGKQPVI